MNAYNMESDICNALDEGQFHDLHPSTVTEELEGIVPGKLAEASREAAAAILDKEAQFQKRMSHLASMIEAAEQDGDWDLAASRARQMDEEHDEFIRAGRVWGADAPRKEEA